MPPKIMLEPHQAKAPALLPTKLPVGGNTPYDAKLEYQAIFPKTHPLHLQSA